jgi:hypothetical protein
MYIKMSNLTNTLNMKDASEKDQASAETVTKKVTPQLTEDMLTITELTNVNVTTTKSPESKVTTTEDNVTIPKNPLAFNRKNIEALDSLVHLVDTDADNKLDMFCYVKCSESDNKLLKQCRGVVFNGEKLVMKAFPYTIEYNNTENDQIYKTFDKFKEWSFYEAHEGALIRVFNFNNKWYTSTHRKLDAFRSKWASRESFGESFKTALSVEEEFNDSFRKSLPQGEDILKRFQSTLDIKKQYMFLIRNNKNNRIVCDQPERATVFHVGTFIDGKLSLKENINLPTPQEQKFLTVDKMLDFVDKISYRNLQGVIGFTNNNQVKIINKDYQDLFRARGNEPSIKFRYLQVRMNSRSTNMLFHLYPEMAEAFDIYENTLYDIARSIYRVYVQRFIKKQYSTAPKEEFSIIRECHSWHLEDRTTNRISIEKVIQVMNTQTPTQLNHMIRRFRLEKTREKDKETLNPHSDSKKSFEQSPVIKKFVVKTGLSPLLLSQKGLKHQHRPRVATILPRKTPPYKENKENKENNENKENKENKENM